MNCSIIRISSHPSFFPIRRKLMSVSLTLLPTPTMGNSWQKKDYSQTTGKNSSQKRRSRVRYGTEFRTVEKKMKSIAEYSVDFAD